MKLKTTIPKCTKITVFGPPGSGKTTLAKELSKIVNIPVFHLDKLLWNKGWVLRPRQDFLNDHQALLNLETWIIEGTSRSTLDIRYPKSDLVIYLNFSRFVCLIRVFKRFILKNPKPLDKPEGCPEKISWKFLKYLWNFQKQASKQLDALIDQYPHVQLIEIRSNQDMDNLYKSLLQKSHSTLH